MKQMTMRLHLDELIVDSFAGGGGASLGIEMALGRSPDIAINHDPEAIAMHAENHPSTRHYCESVWDVDPRTAVDGRPVGLAWFSPDCKHFSKCSNGKPVSARVRGLADVVVKWAVEVKPRVIILENVEEFRGWGPLDENDKPIKARKGEEFVRWWDEIVASGYVGEARELRGCDFGAPTTRNRLFIIFRCDGEPIEWPEPTHGPGRAEPFRTAADCIDWWRPCPSIFMNKRQARAFLKRTGIRVQRPLAKKTMRRIARGLYKHVLTNARPFLVPVKSWGGGGNGPSPIDQPLRTVTCSKRGEFALVAPTLIQTGYGERKGQVPRSLDLHAPLGTAVAGGVKHAVVAAFIKKAYSETGGGWNGSSDLAAPLGTVTTRDHNFVVASSMVTLRGTSDSRGADEPVLTIAAHGNHIGEVRAFLTKYYGNGESSAIDRPVHTITTKDRFGIVTVEGTDYQVSDIGLRMLVARELYRAQSFPDSYIIDLEHLGTPLTAEAQVRMCGNSVCPKLAQRLVQANYRARRAVPIESREAAAA